MPDTPRSRRLRNDLRTMERLREESSVIDFQTRGSPADYYILTFHGRGLSKVEGGTTIELRDEHVVHVQLGSSYPRMMPDLSWRTPVFHPNISAGGHVCLGGYGTHWVPSVQLDELCHMLWDMIRYANFDIKSPYNREAAQWVRVQTDYRFPLDHRPLRDRVACGSVEPLSMSSYGESQRPAVSITPITPASVRPIMHPVLPSAGSNFAAPAQPAIPFIGPPPVPTRPAEFEVNNQSVAELIDQTNRSRTPPPILAHTPASEVVFLSDVVEGELVPDEADEGITFLN